jgi:hypothetical protein
MGGRLTRWLKQILSVNPQWRESMLPPTFRPPADTQPEYKEPEVLRLRPEDYLYHGNRDNKLHNPQTIVISSHAKPGGGDDDTCKDGNEQILRPYRMTLFKDSDAVRNPGEYFNISHYK